LASPSAPISGRIVAAIIGLSEESGPSTKIRDGPNTADVAGSSAPIIDRPPADQGMT